MESVGRPWLSLPDDSVEEQGGEIATPGRSVPPNALLEILGIALEGSGQGGLGSALDFDLPIVVYQPAGNAIVIVCCCQTDTAKPFLVGKVPSESRILNDTCTNSRSPSRQTRYPTINVCCSANVKVPALEVGHAEEVPEVWMRGSFKTKNAKRLAAMLIILRWGCWAVPCIAADCSRRRIFERGEHIGQECCRPKDIVVSEKRNGCLDCLKALDHLKTLVCFRRSQNLDVEEAETLAELLEPVHVLLGGDNNDGVGIASCNRQDASAELIVVPKSWNDHGNVFGGKARGEERADWFVGPCGNCIDDGASVTPEPMLWRMVSRGDFGLGFLGELTRGTQTLSGTASWSLAEVARGN